LCPAHLSVPHQHEKYSSQLQLNHKRALEGEASRKVEVKEPDGAAAAPCELVNSAKPPEACRDEDKMAGQTTFFPFLLLRYSHTVCQSA